MSQENGQDHKSKVTLKSVLLLLVIFIGLPAAGLAILWKDRCQKTVIATLPSPDGAFTAEQVLTDCGTSMRIASEVKLKPSSSGEGEKTVLLIANKEKLAMSWTDSHSLSITLPPDPQVATYAQEWRGIKITAVGLPEPKMLQGPD